MYRFLSSTSKELLRSLRPEFPAKQMEDEYKALRETMVKDFKAFMLFLVILNGIGDIFAAIKGNLMEVYFSSGTIFAVLVIVLLHICFKKFTHDMTLIMNICYNIVRLSLVYVFMSYQAKVRLFFAGYGLASLQGILLLRLVKISHKIYALIVALILRFTYLCIYVEPGSFDPSVFLRQMLMDIFTVYTIYSQDNVFRKVYKDFVEKRDELLKFKELLAYYLPQSLVVVNNEANKILFYNNAFQNTFITDSFDSPSIRQTVKPQFSSFLVEKSTIRETGSTNSTMTLLERLHHSITLEKVLESFKSEGSYQIKTVSLAASLTNEDKRRLFEVTIQKVKWDSADAIAIMFNDITYQEKLIALKMANINKDNVIATVSHELRTPLNGIIGILDITEKKVNDPEANEYLSLCKDNAQLLLSLVNSILDLQQISAGKLKLNPTRVDVRKVFRGICQLFYFQCKQKNIYLEADIDKDVPAYISTDENRLKQILINLVGNAIKFTSKGGIRIEVCALPKAPDSLQVSVTDTGIGIKREDHKHLFKMYSKIEDADSLNKNGVGLGLTISNALAMLLSGPEGSTGIDIESEFGKGTRFFFIIKTNLKDMKRIQLLQNELDLSQRRRVMTISSEPDDETARRLLIQKTESCGEQRTYGDEEDFKDHQQTDYDEFFAPNDVHSRLASYNSMKRVNTPITLDKINTNTSPPIKSRQLSPRGKALLKVSKFQNDLQSQESEARIENLRSDRSDVHVLIVDDNPFNLLVAKSLLQELGCSISTALGGQEAIETVKKSVSDGLKFKVIFMDCQMPIMDGFEATKILLRVMKTKEIPEIPIFGWTANNSEEDIKRCYKAGMIGHLSKPASKSDVLKVISKL